MSLKSRTPVVLCPNMDKVLGQLHPISSYGLYIVKKSGHLWTEPYETRRHLSYTLRCALSREL